MTTTETRGSFRHPARRALRSCENLAQLPRRRAGRPRPAGRFTLIELMTVVALVCVLVAVMLPSYTRFADTAGRVACLQNLRQLQVACDVYVQEASEYFPDTDWTYGHSQIWAPTYGEWYPLEPYLSSTGALACPNAPNESGTKRSYAFNGAAAHALWGYSTPWVGRMSRPKKLAAVKHPDAVIGFCGLGRNQGGRDGPLSGFRVDFAFPGVHENGLNYAYLDGHMGWVSTLTLAGQHHWILDWHGMSYRFDY